MKTAFVSTYPPMRCGIGVYTQKLARAMVEAHPEMEVLVLGERGSANGREGRLESIEAYSRHGEYQSAIVRAAKERGVQLVHFQHAGDLLGFDRRLPETMRQLAAEGIPSVVTLHTVYGPRDWLTLTGRWSSRRFHSELGSAAQRIVVHHWKGMGDSLVGQGVAKERLVVIPHGTTAMSLPEASASKRLLGLPEDSFVFLFFGFIHVQKNVHTVVEAFTRVAKRHPRLRLVIAGMPFGGNWYNKFYMDAMRLRVKAAGLGERVLFRDEYVAPEQVNDHFAAADVVLLPHWQKYGSASGVFHQALGAGKPIIVARGPKFADGMERLEALPQLLADPLKPGQWARSMEALATDEGLRDASREALATYASETLWSAVARRHVETYEDILRG